MDGVSLNLTRINQLVRDEGVISSLRVWDCNLRPNQVRQFVEILEVNRLESLEMKLKVRNTQRFAHALILSLNRHIKTFAERSIFKELELSDTLHGIDSHVQQDLFNVIADLPNLWYFGLDISDVNAFVTLPASLGNWKIRHFKLLCEMGNDVIDFGPLFEAISRSNHLKVFSFGPLITGQVLSARSSTQLLDLAVLPTNGLHESTLMQPYYLPWIVKMLIHRSQQEASFDISTLCRKRDSNRWKMKLTIRGLPSIYGAF